MNKLIFATLRVRGLLAHQEKCHLTLLRSWVERSVFVTVCNIFSISSFCHYCLWIVQTHGELNHPRKFISKRNIAALLHFLSLGEFVICNLSCFIFAWNAVHNSTLCVTMIYVRKSEFTRKLMTSFLPNRVYLIGVIYENCTRRCRGKSEIRTRARISASFFYCCATATRFTFELSMVEFFHNFTLHENFINIFDRVYSPFSRFLLLLLFCRFLRRLSVEFGSRSLSTLFLSIFRTLMRFSETILRRTREGKCLTTLLWVHKLCLMDLVRGGRLSIHSTYPFEIF